MKLLLSSALMVAVEVTLVAVIETCKLSEAVRDWLGVGLLLTLMIYLAYLVSIKRC